jgi:hypothetical protein
MTDAIGWAMSWGFGTQALLGGVRDDKRGGAS